MTAAALTNRGISIHEATLAVVTYSVGLLLAAIRVRVGYARKANAEEIIISGVPIRACRSNT